MPKRSHNSTPYQPPLDIELSVAGDYVPQPTISPKKIAAGEAGLDDARAILDGLPVVHPEVNQVEPSLFDPAAFEKQAVPPETEVVTPEVDKPPMPEDLKRLQQKKVFRRTIDALTRREGESAAEQAVRIKDDLIARRVAEDRKNPPVTPVEPAPPRPVFKPEDRSKKPAFGRIPRPKLEELRVPNSDETYDEDPRRKGWTTFRRVSGRQ